MSEVEKGNLLSPRASLSLRLSNLELLHPLGKGAYGEVRCARNTSTGELLALKKSRVKKKSELVDMKRESRLLKECSSPNIVQYMGSTVERIANSQALNVYIGLEYCEAGSVKKALSLLKKPFSERITAKIISDTLKGLKYLHDKKMMHRDIKADNILINAKGTCKLADFGISKNMKGTLDKRMTMIGTPHYLAPEVVDLDGCGYDLRCDIWSLGIFSIECVEMSPPRFDQPAVRVLFSLKDDPPPTLRDPTHFTPHFPQFLDCCLAKNPDDRQSCSQLLGHSFLLGAATSAEMREMAEHVIHLLSIGTRRRSTSSSVVDRFLGVPKLGENRTRSNSDRKFAWSDPQALNSPAIPVRVPPEIPPAPLEKEEKDSEKPPFQVISDLLSEVMSLKPEEDDEFDYDYGSTEESSGEIPLGSSNEIVNEMATLHLDEMVVQKAQPEVMMVQELQKATNLDEAGKRTKARLSYLCAGEALLEYIHSTNDPDSVKEKLHQLFLLVVERSDYLLEVDPWQC